VLKRLPSEWRLAHRSETFFPGRRKFDDCLARGAGQFDDICYQNRQSRRCG
jgi:hypothetical protein